MKKLLILMLLAVPFVCAAQEHDNHYVRKGNRSFRDSTYNAAVTNYSKAVSIDSTYSLPHYNLGCAYLRQRGDNADSLAYASFMKAAKLASDKQEKSMAYHNMGVLCQTMYMASPEGAQGRVEALRAAIEYYKQALRNNPHDDKARYNLVLCQLQLPKNDNDDNQQNQNQNQDQNQDKDQQNQDQQNQNQNQDQQNQEQNQNKDYVEQMLNATMQSEKEVRDNMPPSQSQRRVLRKQW